MNSYVPNTCVDPPHDDKVEALHFQPQQRNSSLGHLAVTASRDGKFKIWLLSEEQVIAGKMCLINVYQYINHYVHRTREFKLLADKLILVTKVKNMHGLADLLATMGTHLVKMQHFLRMVPF